MKEIKGGTLDYLQSDPYPWMTGGGKPAHRWRQAHGSSTGFCRKGRKIKTGEARTWNKNFLKKNTIAVWSLSWVQLFCDPLDCSPPGSAVQGILQARTLEWVAISSSRILPRSGIEPTSPAWAGGFFTTEPPGKPTDMLPPPENSRPLSVEINSHFWKRWRGDGWTRIKQRWPTGVPGWARGRWTPGVHSSVETSLTEWIF